MPDTWFEDATLGWFRVQHRGRDDELAVIREVIVGDAYHVKHLDLTGQVVVDVGANIGMFSILAILLGAHVFAVEPDDDNLALLHENLDFAKANYRKANGSEQRVTVMKAAVGDPNRTPRVNVVGSGATAQTEPGSDVVVLSFPHLVAEVTSQLGEITLMKVDVEAAEYEWFDTADDTSMRKVNRFTMEFHGAEHLDGRDPEELLARLITKLLRTHSPSAFGPPSTGGMLYAHRY